MTYRIRVALHFAALLLVCTTWAEGAERTEVEFPDIPGYVTLRCDFHTHTVFSDGHVWPTVRAREAWRNGLDAFAVTDHIEYLPHEDDIREDFNRPYEIAKPEADELHLILVKGAEITRDEPHGHFNALFLSDCSALDTPDEQDAVRIANEQGAFVFWNHPEWKRTGYDVWGEIQEGYLQKGWVHGLEVFNGESYYVNAHKWALEKDLTMLANSDVHSPIDEAYDYSGGQHRAMTLVFVKEKTEQGIKEALQAGRTVAFSRNVLVGERQWVQPLFESSVEVLDHDVTLKGEAEFMVHIRNDCAATFELESNGQTEGISHPKSLRLSSGKTVLMEIEGDGSATSGTKRVALPYKVTNIWVAPDEALAVTIELTITFIAEN